MKLPMILAELYAVAEDDGAGEEEGAAGPRRNPKRTGEMAEAELLLKAKRLGFLVAKPWGDSEKYDLILDSGSRLWRVQVKCTEVVRARGYEVQAVYSTYDSKGRRGKRAYTEKDIDVLVAYIPPIDVWYVLPVKEFSPTKSLRFYPDIRCPKARWERFREAWEWMGK